MREILPIAAEWARCGRAFAVATVVSITRSAPREVGASMVVCGAGEVFGNVSGGCVEGAVYERCLEAIATGEAVLDSYGVADADAFAVGLSCGGIIEVLVRPIPPGSAAARDILLLAEREAAGLPTSLALSMETVGQARVVTEPGDPPASDVVLVPFGTPPHLVIVGAVEFSVALARLGAALGFRLTVVDAREVFATPARFPDAEVVLEWPDRYLSRIAVDASTAICVLSHDPKFDVPALRVALSGPAGYVGAMGSRRTHEDRLVRLAEAGVSADAIGRLRSPIGLDLGGRSAQETALSILAEIVAVRHGGSGRPLMELSGPVHRPAAAAAETLRHPS